MSTPEIPSPIFPKRTTDAQPASNVNQADFEIDSNTGLPIFTGLTIARSHQDIKAQLNRGAEVIWREARLMMHPRNRHTELAEQLIDAKIYFGDAAEEINAEARREGFDNFEVYIPPFDYALTPTDRPRASYDGSDRRTNVHPLVPDGFELIAVIEAIHGLQSLKGTQYLQIVAGGIKQYQLAYRTAYRAWYDIGDKQYKLRTLTGPDSRSQAVHLDIDPCLAPITEARE